MENEDSKRYSFSISTDLGVVWKMISGMLSPMERSGAYRLMSVMSPFLTCQCIVANVQKNHVVI